LLTALLRTLLIATSAVGVRPCGSALSSAPPTTDVFLTGGVLLPLLLFPGSEPPFALPTVSIPHHPCVAVAAQIILSQGLGPLPLPCRQRPLATGCVSLARFLLPDSTLGVGLRVIGNLALAGELARKTRQPASLSDRRGLLLRTEGSVEGGRLTLPPLALLLLRLAVLGADLLLDPLGIVVVDPHQWRA
jgi:hypothetical protein